MNTIRDLWNIFRHYRLSTVLNVFGMAVALTVAYIMLVQVYYDYSYNKGIKDYNRLFRVEHNFWEKDYSVHFSVPFANIMVANNPVVEGYHFGGLSNRDVDHTFEKFPDEPLVLGGTELTEGSLVALGVELVEGDFEPVLKRSAMAFSRSVAEKYNLEIGDRVCWGREYKAASALTVGAIFEDFPKNSDLYGLNAFYGPYYNKMESKDWSNWNDPLYVRLYSEDDADAFMQHVLSQLSLVEERTFDIKSVDELKQFLRLTPFDKTHFTTDISRYDSNVVNKGMLFTLLAMAFVVMIIAFVNFFNFFVALIPKRIRSMNTRKILGASTFSLCLGVFLEALLLMLISFALSFVLVYFIENSSLHDILKLQLSLFSNENVVLVAILVPTSLLAAMLMAVYPAHYLTSFQPAFVLKGNFGATPAGKMLRNILIGVQFVLSFVFITVMAFMYMQISFMTQHDKGFESKGIIRCSVNQLIKDYYNPETMTLLFNELSSSPYIANVAMSQEGLVGDHKSGWGRNWSQGEDGDNNIQFRVLSVSWNFLECMGIEIAEGRDFNEDDYVNGTGDKLIFNMTAKKKYGMTLDDWVKNNGERCEIVGFCSDFNERSMQYPIEPFAFYLSSQSVPVWNIYIKLHNDADYNSVNDFLKRISEQYDGELHKQPGFNRMLVYDEFLSETGYREERAQLTVIMIFSFIAVAISLLGVFGLVFFETQYRQKEIALRRINGAFVSDILKLFNLRFVKILLVCFIIALPIATYLVLRWLQEFAYVTSLHWWVYAIAFIAVTMLTLSVVVFSAWSTVNRNPVDVLR